jgi:predicted RNA-binding Zn-ribbon protein involved in translation (DUF1610 family)
MSPSYARLRCPKCGAEMNRHAEKLVYPGGTGDSLGADSLLGGVIEETHQCPVCGNVEARRV